MATNNTLRPTRLIPLFSTWQELERALDAWAREAEAELDRQIELESGMGYYDQGNPGYSELIEAQQTRKLVVIDFEDNEDGQNTVPVYGFLDETTENFPTLAVEAIFWYELGPDDRATIADIPTIKFPPVDPESIELEALPAWEWMRARGCSPYVHYIHSDLF